jgi:hypothetical protein
VNIPGNSLGVIQRKFRDGTSAGPFDVETFTEAKYNRTIVAAQVNTFLNYLDAIP